MLNESHGASWADPGLLALGLAATATSKLVLIAAPVSASDVADTVQFGVRRAILNNAVSSVPLTYAQSTPAAIGGTVIAMRRCEQILRTEPTCSVPITEIGADEMLRRTKIRNAALLMIKRHAATVAVRAPKRAILSDPIAFSRTADSGRSRCA